MAFLRAGRLLQVFALVLFLLPSVSFASATYDTFDPANKTSSITLSSGNLKATDGSNIGDWGGVLSLQSKTTGKWYWEITIGSSMTEAIQICVADSYAASFQDSVHGWCYYSASGNKIHNGSSVAYGATFTSGAVIGVAYDAGTGTVTFYKNGSSQGTAYTGITAPYAGISIFTEGSGTNVTANFGASTFSQTVPSGYNSGRYTGTIDPIVATTTPAIQGVSDTNFGLAFIIFLLAFPMWQWITKHFFGGVTLND